MSPICRDARPGGDGCLEIGYWIRSDRTGRGYATETTHALARIAHGLDGIERVIVCCDPENHASRRIPERLGFTLVEHRVGDTEGPDGEPRDTVEFELRDLRSLRALPSRPS